MAFGNARFLEQLDGISTGPDEHEFRGYSVALLRVDILDAHPPSVVVLAVEIHDAYLTEQRGQGRYSFRGPSREKRRLSLRLRRASAGERRAAAFTRGDLPEAPAGRFFLKLRSHRLDPVWNGRVAA
jgi:hypothetical protein